MYALGGNWDIGDNLTVKSEVVYQESDFETEFFAMRGEGRQYEVYSNFSGIPGIAFRDNPDTEIDESDLTNPELYSMGARSEERRVGKEYKSSGSSTHHDIYNIITYTYS